tara:strand:+ start:1029 stop:1184 length:156 start_codon:yes stop_codon:yes gene_type:complete
MFYGAEQWLTYDQDKNTLALRELNEMLHKDNRIELSMIPVGDGLTIVRKKE